MRSSRLALAAVVAAALAAFLARLPEDAFMASTVPITAATSLPGMQPLEEISGDVVIRQRLVRGLPSGHLEPEEMEVALAGVGEPIGFVLPGSLLPGSAVRRLSGARLCTELLFGTYGGGHSGEIRVTLVTKQGSFSETVDIESLADTEFSPVCFSEAPRPGDVTLDEESELIVEPVAVTHGSSVTLWASPDLRNGHLVEPSEAGGTSLVIHFSVRSDADTRARILLWSFALISVAMAVLAVLGPIRGPASRNEEPAE